MENSQQGRKTRLQSLRCGGAKCLICINQEILTDVIDGAGAELAVELLGSEGAEVVDGEGPQVEHVVPGEGVPLLDHHHLAAEQRQLDGRPQATGPAADDQTLKRKTFQTSQTLAVFAKPSNTS